MNNRLGKKWLAVGAIWSVVLAMTGWNFHLVNQVQSRRQTLATLQMDLHFLQSNQAGIEEVYLQQSRLTHAVQSIGLGFLVVENDLKRLSWDFGLEQMQVEADETAQASRSMTISVVTTGPVPAIVGWVAAVEEAHPYLVTQQLTLSYDERNRRGQLQAVFNYRYTLAEPERTG
jgi:hypothetical protein